MDGAILSRGPASLPYLAFALLLWNIRIRTVDGTAADVA